MKPWLLLVASLAACDAGSSPCSSLSEADCRARADCAVAGCPKCNGGTTFYECAKLGEAKLFPCAALACAGCAGLDLASCEGAPECHPVYFESNVCGCASPGCCMQFDRCADGATASCTGMVTCRAAAPICGSGYSIAYVASCYDGCVKLEDCAP